MRHSTTDRTVDSKVARRSSLRVPCVFALALTLACGATRRAAAESELPATLKELAGLTQVSTRLLAKAKVVAALGDYGFSNSGHCLLGASIAPEQSIKMRVTLRKGREYLFLAAGDAGAIDVDLRVSDPNGAIAADDDDPDAVPMVRFQADQDGEYSITMTLYEAERTSFCALVLMEEDAWRIPFENLASSISGFVKSAGVAALLVDRLTESKFGVRVHGGTNSWCVFGTVLERGDAQTIEKLTLAEGSHVFLSAGCRQATDIDLKVTDDRGNVVMKDTKPDATPFGVGDTTVGSTYEVKTSLPESRGAALVVTGAFDVRRTNDAGLRLRSAARSY